MQMATEKPVNMDSLKQIRGVGEFKLAKYGALFIEVIQKIEINKKLYILKIFSIY